MRDSARCTVVTVLTLLIGSGALGSPALAQSTVALALSPPSRVRVEGTSNVHGWACWSTNIDASIQVPQGPAADLGNAIESATFTVPVGSLDCGHGDMNDNLRKAMHADRHPAVRYRVTSYTATKRESSYEGVVHGTLSINGVDKAVDLRVTVTPNGSGGASAVGSTKINTNDFGVKPVKVLLGTLRTSPDVTITFNLTTVPQ
jgi:hypothetical protein